MKKKLRARRGFTLTELLTAVAILGLIAAALGAGIPTVLRVYRQVTAHSEASVLCSTLSTALADELRTASNVTSVVGTEAVQFDSAAFGRGVSVESSDDGRVLIGGHKLLSDKAYTSGLQAHASVQYDGELFSVSVQILDDRQTLADASFSIRPLNP